MKTTHENLMAAMKIYETAVEKMKTEAIAYISAISEASTKRIGNNPSAFTVSFSTIKENGGILSVFYYDIAAQKRELVKIVNNAKGAEFIQALEEIAKTGKQTIRHNGGSYQQIYAPIVVDALKTFVFEEE